MTSEKTRFILVMIAVPDETSNELFSRWKSLRISLASKAKTNKAVTMLAENTFLIQLDSGLLFVADCISTAENYGLKYKHWFLDEA